MQQGIEWPNPRFMDNKNGTVTDNMTGLIWQQGDCAGSLTWNAAR